MDVGLARGDAGVSTDVGSRARSVTVPPHAGEGCDAAGSAVGSALVALSGAGEGKKIKIHSELYALTASARCS